MDAMAAPALLVDMAPGFFCGSEAAAHFAFFTSTAGSSPCHFCYLKPLLVPALQDEIGKASSQPLYAAKLV